MQVKYTFKNGDKLDFRYDDWVTTENSHHVLLGEEGEIVAGFGGRFNGEKIGNLKETYQINKTADKLKQAKYVKDIKTVLAAAPKNIVLTCGKMTLQKDLNGKITTYIDGKEQAIKGSELKKMLSKGFDIHTSKVSPTEKSTNEFLENWKIGQDFAVAYLPVGSVISLNNGDRQGKWTKQADNKWIDSNGKSCSDSSICSLPLTRQAGLKVERGKWKLPNVNDVKENKATINCNAYVDGKSRTAFQTGNVQQNISKSLGQQVSLSEAKKMNRALSIYTNWEYAYLRKWELTGSSEHAEEMEQTYKNCAKFIDMSPKSQGVLYRGTMVKMSEIEQWQQGGNFKLTGINSFSADENVAQEWASKESPTDNWKRCVFVTNDGIHRATPITHLSYFPSEQENLMHPDATFKLSRIENKDDILYVHIDEQYE